MRHMIYMERLIKHKNCPPVIGEHMDSAHQCGGGDVGFADGALHLGSVMDGQILEAYVSLS